jgi:site-specific recombinase XerD
MFLAEPDSPYVFPELAEMYSTLSTQQAISAGVKKLLHKVGIEDTEKTVEGYARKVSTKDIHSFRHTFVYMASIHGIPLPVVQSIVGHLNPEMTKHYMDHAGRDARLAYMRQLPAYITGGEEPKDITNEKPDIKKRILSLLNRTSKENFERTKARIQKILS